MRLISSKCPNCGADIEIDVSRPYAFCTYCGNKIIIDDEKKKVEVTVVDAPKTVQTKIIEHMFLGDAYMKSNHIKEAMAEYVEALKLDETNYKNAKKIIGLINEMIEDHYFSNQDIYIKDSNANLEFRILIQPFLFEMLNVRYYVLGVLRNMNKYDETYEKTPTEIYIEKCRKVRKLTKIGIVSTIALIVLILVIIAVV